MYLAALLIRSHTSDGDLFRGDTISLSLSLSLFFPFFFFESYGGSTTTIDMLICGAKYVRIRAAALTF
jgi:hypothetical protein